MSYHFDFIVTIYSAEVMLYIADSLLDSASVIEDVSLSFVLCRRHCVF